MKKTSKIIPLNLVLDYPVSWTKFKVLRDFFQNFYDAVGFREWGKKFHYEHSVNALSFRAEKVVFNYEWLVHIGASTKREEQAKYAGCFGEGFKIAALVAVRDFNWKISMTSDDWMITVITSDLIIDGKTLKALAYQL
ncbi:MAG: hypothetical protein WA705_21630, partial [Candidatus Ozemobacteraceae bacterium]